MSFIWMCGSHEEGKDSILGCWKAEIDEIALKTLIFSFEISANRKKKAPKNQHKPTHTLCILFDNKILNPANGLRNRGVPKSDSWVIPLISWFPSTLKHTAKPESQWFAMPNLSEERWSLTKDSLILLVRLSMN